MVCSCQSQTRIEDQMLTFPWERTMKVISTQTNLCPAFQLDSGPMFDIQMTIPSWTMDMSNKALFDMSIVQLGIVFVCCCSSLFGHQVISSMPKKREDYLRSPSFTQCNACRSIDEAGSEFSKQDRRHPIGQKNPKKLFNYCLPTLLSSQIAELQLGNFQSSQWTKTKKVVEGEKSFRSSYGVIRAISLSTHRNPLELVKELL